MGNTAWIALGSNLGDPRARLGAALSRLADVPGVTLHAASTSHETSPVGGPPGQQPFLNAAAGLVTTLSPHELLAQLHAIEDAEGRVRTDHWGARTLDVDLLLWNEQTIAPDPERGSTLVVPHPWLPFRRFVLAPLAEIAPTTVEPRTRQTVAALLANLDRRPSYVAIDDPQGDWSDALYPRLVSALDASGVAFPYVDCSSAGDRNEIDRLRSHLGRKSSSHDGRREQWIVSNFWYPRFELDEVKPSPNLGTFESIDPDLLEPTFVVGAGPTDPIRHTRTPRLEIDPRDIAAAVEKVLAACAASRS